MKLKCALTVFVLIIFIELIESRKKNLHYKTTAAEDSLPALEKRTTGKAAKNVIVYFK